MTGIPCCDNSGGRVALTINGPNGPKKVSLRGSVTIRPTTKETEANANSDGTMYVTTKAVPAEAEILISDRCGLTLDDLLNCTVDASIELIDMKRTYLYTRSRIVGRPELKTEDGEISNLKIASVNVSWFEAA
ncbi:hypothetical protein [uncultured Hyphomicrobium sp.]|uniref:hypothetical protein n=1 Tax=uncultured Hyphomicrobium sp. TaxID=194373 RepID=UPI0025F263AD|nr:hypothetical protein [uncultured Hyphomicrobium sp.]